MNGARQLDRRVVVVARRVMKNSWEQCGRV
jgi:hypothetical protein